MSFTTTREPRSPARLDSSTNASCTKPLEPDFFQKIGSQEHFLFGPHDQIGHVTELVVQRSDDGHGDEAQTGTERGRHAIRERIVLNAPQDVVEGTHEQFARL
jgi:hypothetical protein